MKSARAKTSLSVLGAGAALAILFTSAGASAMTKATGQSNINAKAAASPWVGSPSPAVVNPAKSSCPSAGPCSGWYEGFSNWASIYTWDDVSSTKTFIVGGMILNAYNWFSAANGFLGYPKTDELDTPNLSGKKQSFQGGTVYYKWGATGAFEVHGWIEAKWNALSATTGELGFPISGEESYGSGKRNKFEHGEIIWDGIAGSWQADTWPVMTSASATQTKSARWITGRAVSTSAPSYALYGCGFTPNSTVTVRVNNRAQRQSLGTATASSSGCFSLSTGTIGAAYNIGGVVTFEADDGAANGHYAVAGLPWSFTACFNAGLSKSYFMVRKEGRFTWCVDPALWTTNASGLLGFDMGFPEEGLSKIEDDFGVPYGGSPLTVQVYNGDGGFGTPSDFGAGVIVPGNAFLASPPDWGHISILHETVNQYTSYIAGFWPPDWWADHKSPFPAFVTWRVLSELGLSTAYNTEYRYNHGKGPLNNNPLNPDYDPSYVPGYNSPIWDPQVLFFEGLAASGWSTFAHMFQYLTDDDIDLAALDPDYISKLRTEYVLAYLSLGHGQNLTSQAATTYHVGQIPYLYVNGVYQDCWRENLGCGPDAGAQEDWSLVAYTPSSAVVTAVADAHCRIAWADNAGDVSDATLARAYLQNGFYNSALQVLSANNLATCDANCPSECGCYQAHCAAPWH